jgi:CRP/FNR family cyclic AMP-dependent transcriptional regulator
VTVLATRRAGFGKDARMDTARLKRIPVFADLDDESLTHIAALAAEVSVQAGKELVREGDYSYDVLAIEEGTASVQRGEEHIADLGPGDVIGEMGVLERSQRNATVVATSPMLLVTLTSWDIRKLRKSTPEVVEHLRGVVEQRKHHA